jgi:hypothetical protein
VLDEWQFKQTQIITLGDIRYFNAVHFADDRTGLANEEVDLQQNETEAGKILQ